MLHTLKTEETFLPHWGFLVWNRVALQSPNHPNHYSVWMIIVLKCQTEKSTRTEGIARLQTNDRRIAW